MSDEIKARYDAAHQMISDLCKPRRSEGAREWIMSIPARPDYDPDLVISDSLKDIPVLQTKLDRAVKALGYYATCGENEFMAKEAIAEIGKPCP